MTHEKNTRKRARAQSSLLCLLYSCSILLAFCHLVHSVRKFYTESELTDLSVKAFAGDSRALKKLIRELSRYERRLKKKLPLSLNLSQEDGLPDGLPLTGAEREQVRDIVETLQILAPRYLPHSFSSPETKITVEKPSKLPESADSQIAEGYTSDRSSWTHSAGTQEMWIEEGKKYFSFQEGMALLYAGKSKKFSEAHWTMNGKTLKTRVLKIKGMKNSGIEVLTLNEIFTNQGEWLAEQSLVGYQVVPSGLKVQKEIVFNHPSPGSISPIGKQDPRWIAKFPLKKGDRIEGYEVKSTSAGVQTPLGSFNNCLLIEGLVEKLAFAPEAGLVAIEIFDERWIAQEKQMAQRLSSASLSKAEQKAIHKKIKQFCKKNHCQFKLLLSLSAIEGAVVSRALAYQKDKEHPEQKIFKVIEQKWIKKGNNWEEKGRDF